MAYSTTTDQELIEIRRKLPKYLNEMTPDQKTISSGAYAEQKRRFDAGKAADYLNYNQQVEEAGYKVGDRISYFARSMIGFGGITITGKVAKRKKYYVALDVPMN